MTVDEYKAIANQNKFEEYPYVLTGGEPSLSTFINYDETDLDLKIYLCKLIICRCFSPTGGIYWPDNSRWFITNFFNSFQGDHLKIWLTATIKEASEMILSEDTFTKGIIGTIFMFGVVEFYAKYELGFRPNDYDFFDDSKKDYFRTLLKKKNKNTRELSIGKAFELLQETKTDISNSLNEIDKHNVERLEEVGIEERRWVKIKISDRLSLARNTMLHGENHSFYDKGQYLLMLFILFHFHRTKGNS